jgi:hypothetical protein
MFGRVRIRDSAVSLFDSVRLKGLLRPLEVAVAVLSRGRLRLLRDRDMPSCSSFLVGRCPSWSFSSSSELLDDVSEGDESLRLGLGCLPLSKSMFSDENEEIGSAGRPSFGSISKPFWFFSSSSNVVHMFRIMGGFSLMISIKRALG